MLEFWVCLFICAGLFLGYFLTAIIGIIELLLPGNRAPFYNETIIDDH